MITESQLLALHKEQPNSCLLTTAMNLLCDTYGTDFLGSISPYQNQFTLASNPDRLMQTYELLSMCSLATGESEQRARSVSTVVRILDGITAPKAKPLAIPEELTSRINQRLVVFVAADLINIHLERSGL